MVEGSATKRPTVPETMRRLQYSYCRCDWCGLEQASVSGARFNVSKARRFGGAAVSFGPSIVWRSRSRRHRYQSPARLPYSGSATAKSRRACKSEHRKSIAPSFGMSTLLCGDFQFGRGKNSTTRHASSREKPQA